MGDLFLNALRKKKCGGSKAPGDGERTATLQKKGAATLLNTKKSGKEGVLSF